MSANITQVTDEFESRNGLGRSAPWAPSRIDGQYENVEGTLAVCPKFRILVVGNTGVGKSSLVSSVFNIDIKDIDIAHGRAGKADISRPYTSNTNPRFILHDSQGFEPGSLEKWDVVEGFIRDKCDERLEPKDRLHAIWLCIETPRTGSRLMQTADEEVLKLATNLNVAVIVVFTKYDVLFNEHYRVVKAAQSPGEPASTDTIRIDAEARAKGHLDKLVKAFQPRFEYVTVSTHKRYPSLRLAETTRRCLHEVEGNLWAPWAAAQQIHAQQKVNFSINEGFKKYWINLGKSTVFPGHILSDCLLRIHLDIIEVWNFYDPEQLLSGAQFRENMIKLIESLIIIEPQSGGVSDTLSTLSGLSSTAATIAAPFAQVLSGAGIAVIAVKFLFQKYQAVPSTALCLGAYIVDLTLILHDLFSINILANEPPRPLKWGLIADTLEDYKVSRAGNIHQQIGNVVSGMGTLVDPKEKIADLIREQLGMDKE
ncbi:hypothetical protein EDB89DRAFT_637162 [Lactarius sanguifluus]|nr:hypothetical protein EDB89DRAFT_637162 [Lactarius sanguifluus]